MKKLLTFTEFVNESIGDAIGSPVKYVKIKNNAKKYQKALVQQSLNDIDYEKKKAAAKKDPNQEVGVLSAANKAKNKALSDTASAISNRIDDLATTGGLKKVASLAKGKSKIAAAETALKAAEGEESKQLKIKIKKLNQQAATDKQAIKDYEKDDAGQQSAPQEPPKVKDDKKEDGAAIEAAQKEIDAAKANVEKTKDGDDEAAKIDARIKFKQAQQKKAKLQGNDELYQGLGNDIGELMKDKQGLKSKTETEPEDPVASLEKDIADFDKNIETEMATVVKFKKDLEQAKRDVSTGRGSDTEVLKIQKSLDDSNEDLSELKKRKAEAKKKISSLQKESVTYIGESIADRFRYLMSERLK